MGKCNQLNNTAVDLNRAARDEKVFLETDHKLDQGLFCGPDVLLARSERGQALTHRYAKAS